MDLMQASIRNCFITKPFDLFFEMQHAALEIGDHWVVRWEMRQSASNLFFEHLLPPFEIKNVIWFCHDSLNTRG
jgi:hypothetical protein